MRELSSLSPDKIFILFSEVLLSPPFTEVKCKKKKKKKIDSNRHKIVFLIFQVLVLWLATCTKSYLRMTKSLTQKYKKMVLRVQMIVITWHRTINFMQKLLLVSFIKATTTK